MSRLQSGRLDGASNKDTLVKAVAISAAREAAASVTCGAIAESSRALPQNPPEPSGLPMPVGPSYPTSALQRYFGVHLPSDPDVMSKNIEVSA